MRRVIYLPGLLVVLILLAGCNSFKKTKSGILYKIISDGKGKKLDYGFFYEASVDRRYKDAHLDTLLSSSKTTMNEIGELDSTRMSSPDQVMIFSKLRQGDSLIIKIPTDSILKRNPMAPPFLKKGEFLYFNYKIINVFEKKAQADSAYQAQLAVKKAADSVKDIVQLQKDNSAIQDYLSSHKINAVKAPLGTYVEIINPGTGDLMDTSKVAKVFYTGKVLGGDKAFDSNTDSTFHHLQPLNVRLKQANIIKGWTDGLSLLRSGSVARFYIPSSLGFGARGGGAIIPPNANLVFDIQVTAIETVAQADAEAAADRAKAQARQKQVMDSLNAVKAKDSAKNK